MCKYIMSILFKDIYQEERAKCMNNLDEYRRILMVMSIFDENSIMESKMENGLNYKDYYTDKYIMELKRCEKYI